MTGVHPRRRPGFCLIVPCILLSLLAWLRRATTTEQSPLTFALAGSRPSLRKSKPFQLGRRAFEDGTVSSSSRALPAGGTSPLGGESEVGDAVEGSAASSSASLQLEVEDRFGLVYTCGRCDTRNAVSVSRVAWNEGVVVATCRGCGARHLLADKGGLLDLTNETAFRNVVEFVEAQGNTVKKLDRNDAAALEALNLTLDDNGRIRLREAETAKANGKSRDDAADDGSAAGSASVSTADTELDAAEIQSASSSDDPVEEDVEAEAIRILLPDEAKPGDTVLLDSEYGVLHVVVPADAYSGCTLEVAGLVELRLDEANLQTDGRQGEPALQAGQQLAVPLPDGVTVNVNLAPVAIEEQALRLGHPVDIVP
mmetsp:Transcript_7986/g.17792  ORF Transcript_7986/g.17792 Transcript_7986/m.17792 type:complete len:369 (+) Transcript_7986:117-1223(+)